MKQKSLVTDNGRMMNLELCRIKAMMMVVVLHFLGKGGLLGDVTAPMNATGIVAWIIELLCIVAVNLYMLLSGYLLGEAGYKVSRLLKLYLQVWTYSMGIGIIGVLTGMVAAEEINTYFWLRLLFPISMEHYWFMTAYVFLYLLLPFISMAIQKMSQVQLRTVLIFLVLAFCVSKSVLPIKLTMDKKGYDCLWYLTLFVTGAYIRKYDISFLTKARALLLYFLASALAFCELFCLHKIYLRTGRLQDLITVSANYNHIFPFLAAVGLFVYFKNATVPKWSEGIIARVAPLTLGVYLLHENLALRYQWYTIFSPEQVTSVFDLLIRLIPAVLCVFLAGICVEAVRLGLMKGLHRILMRVSCYRWLMAKITWVDDSFRA